MNILLIMSVTVFASSFVGRSVGALGPNQVISKRITGICPLSIEIFILVDGKQIVVLSSLDIEKLSCKQQILQRGAADALFDYGWRRVHRFTSF